MKAALQVWFIAAIAECIIYSIISKSLIGGLILPFALAGGLPGMFLFWFIIEGIHSLWDRGTAKWVTIILCAFACANGTLVLFLLVMSIPINEMPFFPVLNAATLVAIALSLKKINRLYFTAEPALIDAEEDNSVYEFKNIPDEN